jgi:hypothetical protein
MRMQVERWDFVPTKTSEYLLSDVDSRNGEIAEDMFVFIVASGHHLTWRCSFAVLEYSPYLRPLRSLAESWVRMTADRGGTDCDVLHFLGVYGLGLGGAFGDVLAIYKAWPPAFRNHRLLMMTALASGDPENILRAVTEIKAAPEMPRGEAGWLAYLSGVPFNECELTGTTDFAGFGPFFSQKQCDEVGEYLVQRLNMDVGYVPLAEGIESYCELKHKRARDEDQVMEMVRVRVPEPFRREVIRGMILKRVSGNVARLMTLYPVVDFRGDGRGGPLEVLRMTDLRERMKSGRPDQPESLEETRYDIFMFLRVLFVLLIKAEEG